MVSDSVKLNFLRSEKIESKLSCTFAASPPKRFYKRVSPLNCDGKYEITLDDRKLKTPSGAPFYVTSEPLALAGKPSPFHGPSNRFFIT